MNATEYWTEAQSKLQSGAKYYYIYFSRAEEEGNISEIILCNKKNIENIFSDLRNIVEEEAKYFFLYFDCQGYYH